MSEGKGSRCQRIRRGGDNETSCAKLWGTTKECLKRRERLALCRTMENGLQGDNADVISVILRRNDKCLS